MYVTTLPHLPIFYLIYSNWSLENETDVKSVVNKMDAMALQHYSLKLFIL